jgi:hypothetical protein
LCRHLRSVLLLGPLLPTRTLTETTSYRPPRRGPPPRSGAAAEVEHPTGRVHLQGAVSNNVSALTMPRWILRRARSRGGFGTDRNESCPDDIAEASLMVPSAGESENKVSPKPRASTPASNGTDHRKAAGALPIEETNSLIDAYAQILDRTLTTYQGRTEPAFQAVVRRVSHADCELSLTQPSAGGRQIVLETVEAASAFLSAPRPLRPLKGRRCRRTILSK